MKRRRPPHFSFETVWDVAAPVEAVWEAIHRSEEWPQWWRGLEAVQELEPGDHGGVGNVRRYLWRGVLPYRIAFTIRVVRVERPYHLEGVARGDVCGTGRWRLAPYGDGTRVVYRWRVGLRRAWMRGLYPVAAPLFAWSHGVVMDRGARGLARRLGRSVVPVAAPPTVTPRPYSPARRDG